VTGQAGTVFHLLRVTECGSGRSNRGSRRCRKAARSRALKLTKYSASFGQPMALFTLVQMLV